MTAVCEIFNLLHFRWTAQGGGAWPKCPNGKYAHGCANVLDCLFVVFNVFKNLCYHLIVKKVVFLCVSAECGDTCRMGLH